MPRTVRWAVDIGRADILDREGDFRRVEALTRKALAEAPAASALGPGDWRLKREQTLSLLADARYYLGDHAGALALYQQAAATLDGSAQADARLVYRHAYVAYNIASTLTEMGRKDEALGWIERGVADAARLRSFEDSPRARHMQNIVTLEYAQELQKVGRNDEAVAQARASVAGRKARLAWQPDSFDAARAVPVGLRPAAEVFHAAGRTGDACATIAEADRDWATLGRRYPLTRFDLTDEMKVVSGLRSRWRC